MGGPSVEWPGAVKWEALLRRDRVGVAEGGGFEEEGFGGDFWRGVGETLAEIQARAWVAGFTIPDRWPEPRTPFAKETSSRR